MALGTSSIWRADDPLNPAGKNGTEGQAESSIQFELTPASNADSTSHVHQTEIRQKSGVGENEKVFGPANELQDTKFESLTFIITGSCQINIPPGILNSGTRTNSISQVKIWMLEDKIIKTTFPKGLFGLRLNDVTEFNISPNSTRGILIQDWTWTRPSEQANRIDFMATLRYNLGTIGTRPYNW